MANPDQFQQEVASNLGNFPFVYYGSYQIEVHDISFFSIYYNGNLPHIKLVFYDTLNLMKDKAMPLDDSKIKVFLNPRSTQLKEILIEFKITNFFVNDINYILEGILDVNLLHVIEYKSYPKLTSHKALQQVAKEAGIGFNTNIDDTNDEMTWINPGDYVLNFMEEIVNSSYKSDNSFVVSFIDFYYNFNLVDVAKELDRNIDNDLAITDSTLSEAIKTDNKELLTNLILTNDESFRDTNLFFEAYKIINNSTEVSLEAGYKNTVKYYDSFNKNLLIFDINSITSKGDKSIILKGSPQDEEFYNLNTNIYYMGTFDVDNCHKNYNFSQILNEKNIFDLEKMGLEITMRTPNYSIYKFQKIKIFLSNQINTPATGIKNERLSGEWLITDIKYIYSSKKFSQVIKLIKRELELSDEELSNESPVTSKVDSNTTLANNPTASIPTNNPIISPTSSVITSATASATINSILTKDIWNLIYNGRVNQKIIQTMYAPMISALNTYGIDSNIRIAAFLSQVNIVSSYLLYVTELQSGSENNNNINLGNGSTDGVTYKGRGLIQIIGKNMYKEIGQFLNQDFINNPTIVAAENLTHLSASDTSTQLNNCALVSVGYWLKGSSWGNLNNYADKMDITKTIDTSSYYSKIPNLRSDMDFGVTTSDNFATSIISSNNNLLNFTLISFGISGDYTGYSDKINEWNRIRQYFV